MSDDIPNTSSYDIDAEQIKKLHEFKERIPQEVRSYRRADGELMHDDNEFV